MQRKRGALRRDGGGTEKRVRASIERAGGVFVALIELLRWIRDCVKIGLYTGPDSFCAENEKRVHAITLLIVFTDVSGRERWCINNKFE